MNIQIRDIVFFCVFLFIQIIEAQAKEVDLGGKNLGITIIKNGCLLSCDNQRVKMQFVHSNLMTSDLLWKRISREDTDQFSLENVWSRIGCICKSSKRGNLKTLFVISPDSVGCVDLHNLSVVYDKPVVLLSKNNLEIKTSDCISLTSSLVAWQEINGSKKYVDVEYILSPSNELHFIAKHYMPAYALNIECAWSKKIVLNESGMMMTVAMASDATGNIYVCGTMNVAFSNIMNRPSFRSTSFVAKLNDSGALLWTTNLSRLESRATNLCVNKHGDVYVCGDVLAHNSSLVDTVAGSVNKAFLAKISSDGNVLWSSCFGGDGVNCASSIVTNDSLDVFVAGTSMGSWGNPLTKFHANGSETDAYVAKFSCAGEILWNTFIGGNESDGANVLRLDKKGNVYLGGYSASMWGTPRRPYSGNVDGFIAKLSNRGALLWNTFIGGDGVDYISDLKLDNDSILIYGHSTRMWGDPLNISAVNDGIFRLFIATYNKEGNLVLNSFFNANSDSYATNAQLDRGQVYISGYQFCEDIPKVMGSYVYQVSGSYGLIDKLYLNGYVTSMMRDERGLRVCGYENIIAVNFDRKKEDTTVKSYILQF